jgi:hypothetical protein
MKMAFLSDVHATIHAFDACLEHAVGNHVSVIVLGAATHGLMTQRLVATVPIKVAMNAPCTVILVKQPLPFALLEQAAESLENKIISSTKAATS